MAPKPSKRSVAATAASNRKSVQFWGLTAAAVAVVGFGVWLAMAPIPGDQRPPMGANAAFDRAQRYHAQGEGAKAIAECQAVVDRAPEFADGHYTLALYMRLNGDHAGSLRHNQLAIRYKPNMPEAYINGGVSAVELGDRKLAREYYLKALEISPQFFAGFNSMGILDQDEGRVLESRDWYRKALAVRPQNSDEIRIKLALIMPPVYQSLEMMTREWARVRKDVQRLIDRPEGLRIGDAYRDVGMAPFYLAYSGLNARPIMESVYHMFSRADPNLNFVAPHLQAYVNNGLRFGSAAEAHRELPLSPGGKYRVGIISRHFRWHSIGKFMRGIIKYLPRDQIELYVLFPAQSYDDTSREIEQAADRFVRVNLQLRVARQQIAQLKLHALMYADIGMESFTYYLAFSRLAPVQLVTHGHPCTTGLPSIDYFVSFEEYEPQSNQKFYSERLVRIAGYSSRYIRPQPQHPPQNRTAWGFTYDDHIYMAPQSIFKFHPSYDGIMVGVLAGDPHAKLSIIDERHEGWAAKLLARLRVYAKDHAIDPAVVDRIVFVPRVPNAVFLNYLAEADVLLDPHPFGGDTSTREALLMGTPVVTMESEQLAGRYSSAFVRRIGLGAELVVPDAQHYVQTALRIGTDAAYRADLKRRVAASSHLLFDDQATVDAWAKLYVEKVQSAMRGEQIVRVQHTAKDDGAAKADKGADKKTEKSDRAKKARRS